MTGLTQKQLGDFKKRLEDRRLELRELAATSQEGRKPVELDQARVGRLSRMDALQDQAMSLETDRRRQGEISSIEAALKRMADGDYGFCLSCGEDIALKRLAFDPTLPTCVHCAQ